MNLEFETWKDIEGFDGDFQISDWGRVKSVARLGMPFEKMLTIHNKNGMTHTRLTVKNKKYQQVIKKVVWKTFMGEDMPSKRIQRKDINAKYLDRLDNLYLKTIKKPRKKKDTKIPHDAKRVMELFHSLEDKSDRNIGRIMNINHFTIAKIIESEYKTKFSELNKIINKRVEKEKILKDFKLSQIEKFNKYIHTYE